MPGVELATAYISLAIEGSQVAPQVRKSLGVAGAEGDKAGKAAGKGFSSGFGGAAKSIGAGLAAGVAAVGIKNFLGDSLAEARESQKVGALTTSIIKSTGGAAKISAEQVGSLAGAISAKSGIDDEAIQSGSNLLLTFKNVRNEVGAGNDIFNQATQAAVDLSAAGFGSIEGASKMLGKALNDPVKGMSALGRAGVTFTEAQKAQVKAMVKSGDVLGAQKIIMAEVESQVGGAAAATATAGEKASVAFGNLKESAGTLLLPVIDKLASVFSEKVAPAIQGFIEDFQKGDGVAGKLKDGLGQLTAVFKDKIVPAVQGFIDDFKKGDDAAGKLRDGLEKAGTIIKNVAGFIKDHSTELGALVVTVGTAVAAWKVWQLGILAWQAVTKTAAAVQAAFNLVLSMNPIGLVIIAIAALAAGLIYAYKHSESFRDIVKGAFDLVKTAGDAMWTGLKAVFRFVLDAFLAVASGIVHGAADAFGWVPGIGDKLKGAAKAFDKFRDQVNASLDSINDTSVSVNVDFKTGAAVASAHGDAVRSTFKAGFSDGGWTGPGAKFDPAGFVHADEYVIRKSSQRSISAAAPGFLDALNRYGAAALGYASGGLVFNRPTSGAMGRASNRAVLAQASKSAQSLFASVAGTGSGVQRWAGVALQAMAMAGLPSSYLPLLLHRMQVESGGNPNAINLWDSNAKAGVPSQGLMQVIPPTFAAYAGSLRGLGLLNPLANIYAAIRYTLSRYGLSGIERAWGGNAGYSGGGLVKPLLFDSGGYLPTGVSVVRNDTGRPEPLVRADRMDSLAGLTISGTLDTPWGPSDLRGVVVDEMNRAASRASRQGALR